MGLDVNLAAARGPLLLGYLRDVRAQWTGFVPGRMDCANFAHGWFMRLGGRDLRAHLGFEYHNLEAGKRKLAACGFDSLGDLAASVMLEVPVAEAVLGDIGLIEAEGDFAFGILGGPQVHVLTLQGLGAVAVSKAVRVFRP